MNFNSKRRPCCDILHGLNVVQACDNCGTVVVERDAGKHTTHVIDSVRAKKALECVEALIRFSEEKSQYYDLSHDEIDRILEKHGFQIGKKA